MADHLRLPEPTPLSSRRAGGGGGGRPARTPSSHGAKLKAELAAVTAAQPSVRVQGVDPRHVFKIEARSRIGDGTLANRELEVLGDTEDWTYIVLPDDASANGLADALDRYAAQGSLASMIDVIDAIIPYGPEDRLTEAVARGREEGTFPLVVDAEIWPSSDGGQARERIQDVERAAQQYGGQVLGQDYRPTTTTVRVRCSGAETLDALADLMVVQRIRLPLAPLVEPSDWLRAEIDDLETGPPLDTVVGVLDDGVATRHPLLAGVVVSEAAFPAGHPWKAFGPHGSLVAGLSAYGGFEDAVRAGELPRPVRIAVARILEPANPVDPRQTHMPSGDPDHDVVEQAIRQLFADQGVRVFNLSVTDPDPYRGPHVSLLTYTLDALARELDIVIVVAAGNRSFSSNGKTTSGADVLADYPTYMVDSDARLAEPAPASLTLTVGSIGFSDAPSDPSGTSHVDERAVAGRHRPSPFSRSGPGATSKVKPDVVAEGGDINHLGHGIQQDNVGLSVVSLSHEPSTRLFRAASGTSFAAPRVANMAARLLDRYPTSSANLVRALIGLSAVHPHPTLQLGLPVPDLLKIVGAGLPAVERSLDSSGTRVVMTFEGEVNCDTSTLHPVPIPVEFATGKSDRTIAVALAFDPPVRRQRREYIAGQIKMDMYRNTSVGELRMLLERQSQDSASLPSDRRRVRKHLLPGTRVLQGSTLRVVRWDANHARSLNPDDGDHYFLALTHTLAPWAETDYKTQRYAIAVALEDRLRPEIDLYNLVQTQVSVPARVRVRV